MKLSKTRLWYLFRLNLGIVLFLAALLWMAYCVIIVTAEVLPNVFLH